MMFFSELVNLAMKLLLELFFGIVDLFSLNVTKDQFCFVDVFVIRKCVSFRPSSELSNLLCYSLVNH